MIGLTDFCKGGKAYILIRNRGRNIPPEIRKTTVTCVGKKYVHVSCNKRYERIGNINGLLEVKDYGDLTELYATKEQAVCEIEREKLINSVRRNMSFLFALSLEELRDINKLLCERGGVEE